MHRCTLLHAKRSVPTAHNANNRANNRNISFKPAITSTFSRPWRRRRPTLCPGAAPRPRVGSRSGAAWRPAACRGIPLQPCHARPRARTPGGPCRPSPMAPAAPHGKPPQNGHPARRVSASPLSTGPPRDHGALHRHRHASATTLRFISLPPRGILQWPEEQSRSGCGQDGGDADQSQHRRMWRCRSSCPLLLARPFPPRQPPCSQPPPLPRRSIV